MKVIDAMEREIISVDESISVTEASEAILKKGAGCAIILSKGKPIGMMTERDVTFKVAAKGLNPIKIRVGEIMSSPLVEIDPDSDLVEASKLMEEHKVRRIAVVKQGVLYGVISALDIARNLEGYVEEEVRKIIRYAFFMT